MKPSMPRLKKASWLMRVCLRNLPTCPRLRGRPRDRLMLGLCPLLLFRPRTLRPSCRPDQRTLDQEVFLNQRAKGSAFRVTCCLALT